ncbi:YfiR family protein [Nitrospina gracilis]|uniref:YfiR family protein n=1 Tax=Nitrospina gracilis TaxID=35801 RepID=UPI001F291536|nr:YfiR family protein [Nitrospina gracilis]
MLKRGGQRAGKRWKAALLAVFAWLLLSGFHHTSQTVMVQIPEKLDHNKATALKVAYLRYIAEYTTWPDSKLEEPGAPINFCVLGHDVEGLARRINHLIVEPNFSIQDRPVRLEILSRGILPFLSKDADLANSLRTCHLLYVLPSEKDRWDKLSGLLKSQSIVTVSEMEGFSDQGGMIQFVLTPTGNGSLRYTLHINLKHCQRAGLRLSSKFLSLKQAVRIVEFPD